MLSNLAIALVAANLVLLFVLLGAPLGRRTITMARRVAAPPERLWQALFPLGANAGWSGEVLEAVEISPSPLLVRERLSWEGRDGKPIERVRRFETVVEGRGFEAVVLEDTALDPRFWANYRERLTIEPDGEGMSVVTMARSDLYRGAAMFILRYFAMRRELSRLDSWLRTGRFRRHGLFEHPVTQVGVGILSTLLLWPLFGLNPGGLSVAVVLTLVVALHEFGHLAAFRVMGHRKVRMIFIPLLGGVAIGGRPYDSRFEVAFVALMGAGCSAFLVPVAMIASTAALASGNYLAAALLGTLVGITGLFNLANLFPIWKFDGGQVLRQICTGGRSLALASFAMALAFLAVGYRGGMSGNLLVFCAAVLILLSLATAGTSVRPRHALRPMSVAQRAAIAAALLATFSIHAHGTLWAAGQFFAWQESRNAASATETEAPGVSRPPAGQAG